MATKLKKSGRETDVGAVHLKAWLHYSDLPYHNFRHACAVVAEANLLMDRCNRHGIFPDRAVVKCAIYFHDAGYAEDSLRKGFASKEAYSASLATSELLALGHPQEFVERVAGCIMATRADAQFETIEQKVVRAADLAGIAADYPAFKSNADALRAEAELLTGRPMSGKEWTERTEKVLGHYLSQDIRLTPEHDRDGHSVFHEAASENLRRYLKESGEVG